MADNDVETELDAEEASAEATARLRSKNGVPRAGLATIDAQAQKIWVAARKQLVPPVTVARALTGKNDSKASGGAYRSRIAALRVFKVIEAVKGGQFRLSDLGVALANTGDADAHTRALKATMQGVPAYAQILARYDGGELPGAGPIATQFEFEYELSRPDATAAADLFIESAKYAGLIDDAGNVNLDGAPPPPDADDERLDVTDDQTDDVLADHEAEFESPGEVEGTLPPAVAPPLAVRTASLPPSAAPSPAVGAVPVGINVKLDMSSWAVDDVLRVLDALGYESPGRA